MAQSRQEIYRKYNAQNPVLSVRTKNKDRFFDLAKKLDLTAEQLFNNLFESYVPVSNRVSKAAGGGNFERFRQHLADYLAGGGNIKNVLDMLEEFESKQNMRETQQESEGTFMGKMSKQQVEEKRGEVLDICRKALTSPDAGVEIARQAAELFIALGGSPAELGQIAKGENPQPGQNIAKAKAQNPRKSAEELKEEALSQPEIQQHSHLFKARGWL